MKKSFLLKGVLVFVLSLVLVANLASVVRADDFSSVWDDPTTGTATGTDSTGGTSTADDTTTDGTSTTGTVTTDGTTTGTTDSTATGTDTSTTDDTSSISTGSATTTLDTNDDESENEVNSLAYTGIESNSVLPVVIIIGAIVAGYSLRKIREYNNI